MRYRVLQIATDMSLTGRHKILLEDQSNGAILELLVDELPRDLEVGSTVQLRLRVVTP